MIYPKIDIKSMRFENMSFAYDRQHIVYKDVNLEIPTGEIVWVRGERGDGQSTFLKLLSVMLQPTSGAYYMNDANTSEMSFEEFMPFRLRIGVGFDYGGLFANRTLYENLILGPLYHKMKTMDALEREVKELADEFGIQDELDNRPASVPGGLRKLTCVLRPLLMHPQVMVLDDPITGLDSDSADLLYRVLTDRWASGEIKHIFFSARDRAWAEKFSTKVLPLSPLSLMKHKHKPARPA